MVMHNVAVKTSNYEMIIANPRFKAGWHEVWDGQDHGIDISWSDEDQEAYERGRQFATALKRDGEAKIPLTRGFMAHPRAQNLLMMAMRCGDVL